MEDENYVDTLKTIVIKSTKRIVVLEREKVELEKVLRLVRKDLLMRAEEDSDGCTVVDLSSFIWAKLNEVLKGPGL